MDIVYDSQPRTTTVSQAEGRLKTDVGGRKRKIISNKLKKYGGRTNKK